MRGVLRLVQRQRVRAVHDLTNRMTGPYALVVLGADRLQRRRAAAALVQAAAHATWSRCSSMAMVVNVGMWLERFVIIVTSLHRDFLPSSWGMYYPTIWDFMTFFGTIGLFLTLIFLFIRVLPMISIFEMRTLLPEAQGRRRHRRKEGRTDGPRRHGHHAVLRPDGRVRLRAGAAGRRAQDARTPATAKIDAYSPFPIHELAEALGYTRTQVALHRPRRRHHRRAGRLRRSQYWASVIAYPLNIGGRPLHSWPSFIPPAFEMTILFAAFSAVIGMIALNGLPQPYHPVFNVPRFALATPGQVLPGDRGERPEVRRATPRGSSCRASIRTRWCKLITEDMAEGRRHKSEGRRELRRQECGGRALLASHFDVTSVFCLLPSDFGGVPPGHARRAAVRPARGERGVFRTARRRSRSWPARCARGGACAMLNETNCSTPARSNGQLAAELPFADHRGADLDRGEERFNIYCTPCHGRTGEGNGMVVQRGYRQAAVVPHRPAAPWCRSATSSTS